MFDQFMKGFESYKLPQFDSNKLFAIQQKNVETFTAIAKEFGESAQEIAQKSAAYAQENVEAVISASSEVFSTTAPDQNAAKQGELAKKSAAKSTKQAKELTELATKTQFKAFDTLNKRFGESIEEAKELAKKAA